MKKILLICFALVLAASMSISAFAADGGFVSSPIGKPAPVLLDATNSSDDCVAELVITSYNDRDTLPEDTRKLFEEAYSEIKNADNLISLNKSLATIAKDLGIKTTDLAISDLFDISAINCEEHEDHGAFDITLEADALDNFVALLHYYDGEWTLVENAEVQGNGNHLVFEEKVFSPFAIVVSAEEIEAEEDGSLGTTETIVGVTAVIAAANACATVYMIISSKEKRK